MLDGVEFVGVEPDLLTAEFRTDALMAACAFLGTMRQQPRADVEAELEHVAKDYSLIDLGGGDGDGDASAFVVTAVIDPLSEAAQKLAPLLRALRDLVHLRVRVLLVPPAEVSEIPLKKFYRFVLDGDSMSGGGLAAGAHFSGLPRSHTLTLRMEVPEALGNVQWLDSDADLDNLRCDDASCGDTGDTTNIAFELKSLLVGGQCFDMRDRRPPNGLQVELSRHGDNASLPVADTIVMQNLGYFQLKAAPGIWSLQLAPGRGRELFEIVDDDVSEAPQELPVVISDFEGTVTQLRVRKKAGFENVALLDEIETKAEDEGGAVAVDADGRSTKADAGVLGSAMRWFGGSKGAALAAENSSKLETIHVFSLATGQLYERLLKIMLLSVRKRTTGPVKFWLFENFLSPGFKRDVAAMAGELPDMEVAYVTYQWPEWLRQQTEKQRIIWGYKILFLDVLFPLHVPKIIYVDADQVLRGDLRELWNLDLKGRPYGYTPFCTSRKETLGYQFWRSGYWKDHLRGRPYHISALYVVDLVTFRRRAVGDQLRALYDQLSRDPNSLSNLDQDLPNYAQHMVPIFSLPQKWLWCESWCSDETKETAMTIDLCNHPATKEPKLDMARRIVSGALFNESWVELDEEVERLVSQGLKPAVEVVS